MHHVQTADGGVVTFRGKVKAIGGGAGLPQFIRYRHPGSDKKPALEVVVEVDDQGVPWCTIVSLSGAPGASRVRSADVKAVTGQLDRLVEDMLTTAAFMTNDEGPGWVRTRSTSRPDTRQQALPAIKRARRSRRTITDEHLQRVADIYKATTGPRTEAIAAAFGKDVRTATRYIRKARQEGFLEPTTGEDDR